MKTDIDIKDDIFAYLKGSELSQEVSGKLSKTLRPAKSDKEDVVISILANGTGEIQEAFVNVNIYVADLLRDDQYEENTIRLRELCSLSEKILRSVIGDGYRFSLDEQRVLEVQGKNEHLINNKLLYRYCKY
ncbi:MAG: hypothetical protein HDS62_08515 [Bacteroidales bacterium]|nr:hypothetical protein [Bacteroidales bacterium]